MISIDHHPADQGVVHKQQLLPERLPTQAVDRESSHDCQDQRPPRLSVPCQGDTILVLHDFVIKDNLHDDQIFLQGVDCGESQQAGHSKDAFQVQLIIILILVVIVITMIIINSRIASVSKSVTAMAVMALVDRGLLDLDSKVII